MMLPAIQVIKQGRRRHIVEGQEEEDDTSGKQKCFKHVAMKKTSWSPQSGSFLCRTCGTLDARARS